MTSSMSAAITQNTPGHSQGYPAGVPTDYSWYSGVNTTPGNTPPSNFTAVTSWGQIYPEAGAPAYSNPNATVQIANAKTYVHLESTGEWVSVQNQATDQIAGSHFVADYSGNASIAWHETVLPDGSVTVDVPPIGYNDHFWPDARGTYAAGTVDGVYVQMDMRTNDPNVSLVANVGADWWRDASAGFVEGWSNNPGAGMSNWVELSTQWQTLSFYSLSASQLQADPPPPLVGSTTETTPLITSFSPDTGIVGDGITSANMPLNDTINAGAGKDIVIGGTGNDTMNGGAGNDVFVFGAGFGNDQILQFDANPAGGQDRLDISAFGITGGNFAALVTIADVGADTLITIDGNAAQTIQLVGIGNTTTVTQADFVL